MRTVGFNSLLVIAVSVLSAACSRAEGLTSEVRPFKGMPALYVNDVLTSQMLAAPYREPPRGGLADFDDFRRAGISIFDIYVRFPWTAPELTTSPASIKS